ncbi:MAG TPA: hypothetical protein VG992_03240 [Candidatus Saccharimonadales bacterium]|nr:hypothetical protein [Candidatus Saccharimonadales bacterium]
MELKPLEVTRSLSWSALRQLRLERIANAALGVLSPPEHVKHRLAEDAEARRQRDGEIEKGLGELTLQAHQGQIDLPPNLLDPIWRAVKTKPSGWHFHDLFNPHKARVLEEITPPPEAAASVVPIIPEE